MKNLRHSAELNPRDAPDDMIRGPLWLWHPHQVQAVKHEKRRRFQADIDDVDAPAVFDE